MSERFCKLLREMKADEAKAPRDYMTLEREGYSQLSKSERSQIRGIVAEERRHGRIVGDILEKVCGGK